VIVKVLGTVQDGGVPHLGCNCEVCEKARDDSEKGKYVESIMLKEDNSKDAARYLVNATPDIRRQIKLQHLDGAFIPHEGLGHITGLQFFGQEGPDISELSIHTTEDVQDYIMQNDPYRFLVDRNNIQLHRFKDGEKIDVRGGTIESIQIYHQHLNHDTTAYMIHGKDRKLFYLSDITEFNEDIVEHVERADTALIDGTLWSEDEIGRFEEVPHPPIRRSLDQFSDTDTQIYFTHLNHTNPALQKDSKERQKINEKGFKITEQGLTFDLQTDRNISTMEDRTLDTAKFITGSATVLAALNPSSPISVYAFLFTISNFVGLTFSLSNKNKTPEKAAAAQSTMLSAGFTTVVATYFKNSVPPSEPQNVVVYTVIFILVAIQTAPDSYF